jgi:hypothetical protein
MTDKSAFNEADWETVLKGPTAAGLMVAASSRGGTFRESFAIAKAYTDARSAHGNSELLDAIVSSRPKTERPHGHSFEEIKQDSLNHVTTALGVVGAAATADELAAYKVFILEVSKRVAEAHKEDGQQISDSEQAALDAVADTVGLPHV